MRLKPLSLQPAAPRQDFYVFNGVQSWAIYPSAFLYHARIHTANFKTHNKMPLFCYVLNIVCCIIFYLDIGNSVLLIIMCFDVGGTSDMRDMRLQTDNLPGT